MKKNDLISSLFWFLVGLGFVFGGFRYGFGSWKEPGPGLLPVVFGGLLALLSACLLIPAVKKTKEKQNAPVSGEEKGNWKAILFTLMILLSYMIILKEVGFVLATFLLTFSLLKFVGRKKWITSFFFAAVISIACYSLFHLLLGTPLPKGRIYGSAFWTVGRV